MDFETEKTDEEIYYNTHGQDRELFLAQVRHFREIMCSTQYDFERKDKEWGYVIEAYIRCDLTPEDVNLFLATKREYEIRCNYQGSMVAVQ